MVRLFNTEDRCVPQAIEPELRILQTRLTASPSDGVRRAADLHWCGTSGDWRAGCVECRYVQHTARVGRRLIAAASERSRIPLKARR